VVFQCFTPFPVLKYLPDLFCSSPEIKKGWQFLFFSRKKGLFLKWFRIRLCRPDREGVVKYLFNLPGAILAPVQFI
jgi:hypothetical protein